MKLIEKLKVQIEIPLILTELQRLEKIADDYAIEFAEWIDKNHKSISLEIYSNKKELLEIFKKEKGL